MKRTILLLSLSLLCVLTSFAFDRQAFYRTFLKSDLTPWHDYIAGHIEISEDSLPLLLDLEYNYIAWASNQKLDDNMVRLGAFNRHIRQYEESPSHNESDLATFQSASHVYSLSILDKQTVAHSLQALTYAKEACRKSPTARALMHQGFMFFYRPSYAGGDKEKALSYLQKAEKMMLRSGEKYDWNLRNTQLHIAQCLIKLNRKSEAERYIKRVLRDEPNFEFMKTLIRQ